MLPETKITKLPENAILHEKKSFLYFELFISMGRDKWEQQRVLLK